MIKKLFLSNKCQTRKIIYCGVENKCFDINKAIHINNTKKRSEIEHHLGSEYSGLIFNCFDGFNPDLFCALAGLIKAPGVIILLTPDINHWPEYPDPDYFKICSYPYSPQNIKGYYITYLIHKLAKQSETNCFLTLAQSSFSENTFNTSKSVIRKIFKQKNLDHIKQITPNSEQKKVITLIQKIIETKTPEIITIYGNRGRGKSTVIGMALRTVIQQQKFSELKISIVSQNRGNIEPIFAQLKSQQNIDVNNTLISFYPPDEFIRSKTACELLIIDEAAAIPIYVLKQLIKSTNKIIISSTIDGYEGTGLGLKTKLQEYFSAINRPVNSIELTTPQRWQADDPVEHFILDTFLTQKNPRSNNQGIITSKLRIDLIQIEKMERDVLVKKPKIIRQIFQLLMQAHYRTTPDDLRYLLDAPDIELWVANCDDNICGVLMVSNEGGIDDIFEQDIWLGKRRLNGHLIPQTVSSQIGFRQAIRFSYKRIVRIAVEKKYRQKGIASKLVSDYYDSITWQNQNLDFIGVSYGYEPVLYKFWQTLNFKPIRISHRENARSGLKSMIMLRPISMRAHDFQEQLQHSFQQELEFTFNNEKVEILNSQITNHDKLKIVSNAHEQDQLDIYTFAYGNRQFLSCRRSLYNFGVHCLNTELLKKMITQKQIDLITLIVLQNMDWTQSAKRLTFDGKKHMLAELRATYAILYSTVWGNNS